TDRLGVVVIQDGQVFTSREVQKADARPGGFIAAGGHGGIVGRVRDAPESPVLTFIPTRRHTFRSDVRLTCLPSSVPAVHGKTVGVRDANGDLRSEAIPSVPILKIGQYRLEDARMDVHAERELNAWL